MKPIDDDDMGKSLNVLQAFLEFLEYFYPRDSLVSISLRRSSVPILVRRVDYPDGLQFQGIHSFHLPGFIDWAINPLNNAGYLQS
jgi:hypothetical protein